MTPQKQLTNRLMEALQHYFQTYEVFDDKEFTQHALEMLQCFEVRNGNVHMSQDEGQVAHDSFIDKLEERWAELYF